MKGSLHDGWLAVGLCSGLLIAGCASSPSFYRVTDLHSGREYYTQKIDHLASGAVVVKDVRTDSVVTLQSSQVKKISNDEYNAALGASTGQPAASAPAGAPASALTGTK